MSLAELALVGEFVGGLGVFGSLVFVGLQVRRNTLSVRASTLQMNTDFWMNFFATVADPKYSRVYMKGLSGRTALDRPEFSQFFLIMRAYFLGLENQHYQYKHGLLDHATYAGYLVTLREQTFAFSGVRAMWRLVRQGYSPEFAAFVDGEVAKAPLHHDSVSRRWHALVAEANAVAGPAGRQRRGVGGDGRRQRAAKAA